MIPSTVAHINFITDNRWCVVVAKGRLRYKEFLMVEVAVANPTFMKNDEKVREKI